jgi:hypothetical protein
MGHPASGICNVVPASCRHLLLRQSGGRDARATAGETPALPRKATARLRSLEDAF